MRQQLDTWCMDTAWSESCTPVMLVVHILIPKLLYCLVFVWKLCPGSKLYIQKFCCSDNNSLHVYLHWYTCIMYLYTLACIHVLKIMSFIVQEGASPLLIASQNGKAEVVDILLKNGADPNLVTMV